MVFARRVRPWRALLLVVVVGTVLGVGGVWVYNAVRRAQHQTTAAANTGSTTLAPPTTTRRSPSTTVAVADRCRPATSTTRVQLA